MINKKSTDPVYVAGVECLERGLISVFFCLFVVLFCLFGWFLLRVLNAWSVG